MSTDAEKKLAKIEEQNRARVKRFMEKAKEQGKKQISAIISGEAHDTLCRIRDNATRAGEAVSFGQIIERALAVYVKSNVNTNDDTNQPEKPSEQEPVEAPAMVGPEPQAATHGPEPKNEMVSLLPESDRPKVGTEEYTDWYYRTILELKNTMTYKELHPFTVENNIVGPYGEIVKESSLGGRVRDAKKYLAKRTKK
ncbi:hypothetical protein [uncultured Desulfobacter sp.]|uniref:hypothetical protein n=1 Tax=uncultured Desulfobacter sp. TaxID=240139 RepID=UPI002AA62DD6|nr:hypothetical protein [uncultured Desulfobacter sp.]